MAERAEERLSPFLPRMPGPVYAACCVCLVVESEETLNFGAALRRAAETTASFQDAPAALGAT